MKQVLFMAVLAAGMLLAGCSKEKSDMGTIDNTEQQTLTKEQIVGVWRSGDYWVSFSEDGFMCGYLSEKCISMGYYDISEKDIVVTDNFCENNMTTFNILSVSADSFSCNVKCSEIEVQSLTVAEELVYKEIISNKEAQLEMTFVKTTEIPTIQDNSIIGKSFEYYCNYTYMYGQKPSVRCLNKGKIDKNGTILREITKLSDEGVLQRPFTVHMKDRYVLLFPYIYFIELHNDEDYNTDISFFELNTYTVQRRKVTFVSNESILLE